MGASVSRIVEEARVKNGLQDLNLNSVGIKTLPPNLEDFRSLTQVNLANNGIKELPYTVEPFVNLEVVNIHNNSIKRLPEVGTRSPLRILIASVNRIKALPLSMGACINLYSIDLSANKFKEFPMVLCTLTSLRVIHIADNKIKYLPPEIGQLKNLETLDVGNNKIEFLPAQIGGLIKLNELFIEDNKLRVLPSELANIPLVENNLAFRAYHNPLKRRIKKRHNKGNRELWAYLQTDKYRVYLASYMDRWERKTSKKMAAKERKEAKERAKREKEREKWAEKTRRQMEKEGRAVAFIAAPSAVGAHTAGATPGTAGGIATPSYAYPEHAPRKLSPEEASLAVGVAPEIARTAPPHTIQQPVRLSKAPMVQQPMGTTPMQPTGYVAPFAGAQTTGVGARQPPSDITQTGYREMGEGARTYQQDMYPQRDVQQPSTDYQLPPSEKMARDVATGKQYVDVARAGGGMGPVSASQTQQPSVPTHEYYGRGA